MSQDFIFGLLFGTTILGFGMVTGAVVAAIYLMQKAKGK